MRRNQPNVQAKDLPVSGGTNSASFRPGEKRAISGAGTCGSRGTATASARNPAHRPSAASKKKRKSLRCVITADSSRGFLGAGPRSLRQAPKIPRTNWTFSFLLFVIERFAAGPRLDLRFLPVGFDQIRKLREARLEPGGGSIAAIFVAEMLVEDPGFGAGAGDLQDQHGHKKQEQERALEEEKESG